MSKYIFDVKINYANLSPEIQKIKSPLGLILSVDGNSQSIETPSVKSSDPTWNYCARFILLLPNLSHAYIYIKLCAKNQKTNQIVVLATSKCNLKAMPVGSPKNITIPLMNTKNTAICSAKLCLTATISAYAPTPVNYHSQPPYPYSDRVSGVLYPSV
ncbi:hypothetical protein M9Y10_036987 [Tritrichomonas musculus]|uniref:C2 domain-containing protein n=1 Tax=Tritrichomonas musculus TaxID=1915356 RepID=A0ABR2GSN8_9EUKA